MAFGHARLILLTGGRIIQSIKWPVPSRRERDETRRDWLK